MIAPQSWYDDVEAYKTCQCPCTPECPERTMTCKFDGSCGKYNGWRARYDAVKERIKEHYGAERNIASMIKIKQGGKKYRAVIALNKRQNGG